MLKGQKALIKRIETLTACAYPEDMDAFWTEKWSRLAIVMLRDKTTDRAIRSACINLLAHNRQKKEGNNYQSADGLVTAYCTDCIPPDVKFYCTNARKTERCEICDALLTVNYVPPVDDGTFDFLSAPIKKNS